MLDYHISHQLSVGVTVLVQSVNCHKLNVVNRQQTVVSASKYILRYWVHSSRPDPLVELGHSSQEDTVFVPKGKFLITAANSHVFTCGIERNGARIESKVLITSHLLIVFTTRQLID